MTWAVHNLDATALLSNMIDNGEHADLIIVDPAYASLDAHRPGAESCRRLRTWFPTVNNHYFGPFFGAVHDVMWKNAHCYVFCDQPTFPHVRHAGERIGLTFHKFIVWDKVHRGMGYHYGARHELICFFEKGRRKLAKPWLDDVQVHKMLKNRSKLPDKKGQFYPTEKPVSLLEVLVQQSSSKGETVVDPFCGSGSTGEAALLHGRHFVGGDVHPPAITRATKRLARFS